MFSSTSRLGSEFQDESEEDDDNDVQDQKEKPLVHVQEMSSRTPSQQWSQEANGNTLDPAMLRRVDLPSSIDEPKGTTSAQSKKKASSRPPPLKRRAEDNCLENAPYNNDKFQKQRTFQEKHLARLHAVTPRNGMTSPGLMIAHPVSAHPQYNGSMGQSMWSHGPTSAQPLPFGSHSNPFPFTFTSTCDAPSQSSSLPTMLRPVPHMADQTMGYPSWSSQQPLRGRPASAAAIRVTRPYTNGPISPASAGPSSRRTSVQNQPTSEYELSYGPYSTDHRQLHPNYQPGIYNPAAGSYQHIHSPQPYHFDQHHAPQPTSPCQSPLSATSNGSQHHNYLGVGSPVNEQAHCQVQNTLGSPEMSGEDRQMKSFISSLSESRFLYRLPPL